MRRPRRPKMKDPVPARDLIDKLLHGLGLDDRLNQYKALVIWNDVVGPQIAARTRPVRIRDSILEINVDQPAWMQQLQLMKPKILTRLNAELGKARLKDLYLKHGKVNVHPDKPMEAPPAWRMVQLDSREKQQIEDLLNAVQDAGLKKEMEKFLHKQMRLLKAGGN